MIVETSGSGVLTMVSPGDTLTVVSIASVNVLVTVVPSETIVVTPGSKVLTKV